MTNDELVNLADHIVARLCFEETDCALESASDDGQRATISFGPRFVFRYRDEQIQSRDGLIPRDELLSELGQSIAELRLTSDGRLILRLGNGDALDVPSQPEYEAWQVQAPGLFAVAPVGGGEPNVWLDEDH